MLDCLFFLVHLNNIFETTWERHISFYWSICIEEYMKIALFLKKNSDSDTPSQWLKAKLRVWG